MVAGQDMRQLVIYIFCFAGLITAADDNSFHMVDSSVEILKVFESKFLVNDFHVTNRINITFYVCHLIIFKYP